MKSKQTEQLTYGMLLSAAKEAMEEQNLSREQTFELLRKMLGPLEQSAIVQQSLQRLEGISGELELNYMLGQECLRAYGKIV